MIEAVQGVVIRDDWLADLDSLHSLEHGEQQRFHLHAGEASSRTGVGAMAEGEVVSGVSRDVKLVGLRISSFIAIGGTEDGKDALSAGDLRSLEFDIVGRDAGEGTDDGVDSERFVDSPWDERRIALQLFPLICMDGEAS